MSGVLVKLPASSVGSGRSWLETNARGLFRRWYALAMLFDGLCKRVLSKRILAFGGFLNDVELQLLRGNYWGNPLGGGALRA